MSDTDYTNINTSNICDEFKSHEMTTDGVEVGEDICFWASMLLNCMNSLKPSRETSLTRTKLEECVMWANKSIALYDVDISEAQLFNSKEAT